MDLREDRPGPREIGHHTYVVADVRPLDVDGVRTVQVGTALFFLAFLALLPFAGRLADDGRAWCPATPPATRSWTRTR